MATDQGTVAVPPGKEYIMDSLQPELRGTGIAFLVLNTVFYAQRVYSRYLQGTKWGIEDYVMVFAYIMAQAVCADTLLQLNYGVGLHYELFRQVSPELFPSWGANSLYALPILYSVSSTLPKISVLILYLRIIIQRWLRWGCWITMVVLILACILNIFTFAFQCNPVEAAWTPQVQGIKCNNLLGHLTYGPIVNIVTDTAMLVLPLPVLLRLSAPRSVKIGLICTFVLASLGLIASCARFGIFVVYEDDWDYTWVTAQMSIWTCIESSVYFISACLLMCRPLLHKITTSTVVVSAVSKLRPTSRKQQPPGSSSSEPSAWAKRSMATSEQSPRKGSGGMNRVSTSLGISGISALSKVGGGADDELELQEKHSQDITDSVVDRSSRDNGSLEAQDQIPFDGRELELAPAQPAGDAVWTRRMCYEVGR